MSLAGPIVLGLTAAAGFFYLVLRGPLNHPLMLRYFTGHPVCVVETMLCFVCLAALLQKFFAVMGERSSLTTVSLGEIGDRLPASKAAELLDMLSRLSRAAQNSYLGRRLNEALEFIDRKGSTDGLENELKYLGDVDAGRQQDSYALIRIIIWATPMLGFLGTVIGITKVIGDLAKHDMVNVQGAMQGLLSGLYVKFDTTALALSFTVLLMFIQFIIERLEIQVLESVDRHAAHELLGRFAAATVAEPQFQHVQHLAQIMLKSSEQLLERQTQLWQATINAAHQHWEHLAHGAGEQMQGALSTALSQALSQHAVQMEKIDQHSSEQLVQRWEQWQTALSNNARLLHAQQQEMVKQGELINQAIRAVGDVKNLEAVLNENLAALAGAKNFEDTVMSLAAAIHLLNTRLGKITQAPQVELKPTLVRGRAA
jgi:biopolymer transport protein ExbB/TolQ